jgi:Ca-activated chloride channel homolog
MGFLNQNLLFLLFLIPILLLLYMLRLRRKIQVVSSNLLWEQDIEDVKANTLFQRLRKNLLLPLQILILALIILAIARPFVTGAVSTDKDIILIIDTSASMKATDIKENRFESAKSSAIKIVDGLGRGARMTVIRAGFSPTIISGTTSDKSILKETLNKTNPSDTSTNLTDAIQMASSLAKDMRQSEIIILSDGSGDLPKNSIKVDKPIRFVKFGRDEDNNIGIINFEVSNELSRQQVFLSLRNFSIKKQSFAVELYHDKDLIDVRKLNLLPQERSSIIFNDIRYNEGVLTALIDAKDDLLTDNKAYYVLHKLNEPKILIAGESNIFLEKAIETTFGKTSLFREKSYSGSKDYDVIVFSKFVPDVIPESNIMFVNPDTDLQFTESSDNVKFLNPSNPLFQRGNDSISPFGKGGKGDLRHTQGSFLSLTLKNQFAELLSRKNKPNIIGWDRSNQLMRFVDLSELRFSFVNDYNMPTWMKSLVESDMATTIWYGENNGRRNIVIPFEIRPATSNFPLIPAFPIFISNAINWLSGRDSYNTNKKTGEPIQLLVSGTIGNQIVTIKKPDGSEIKTRLDKGRLIFNETNEAGIYQIIGKGISNEFAVNLLDESESNVKPSDIIKVSEQEIHSSGLSLISNRELWTFLIFIALMLIALEWWVYHRRVLV